MNYIARVRSAFVLIILSLQAGACGLGDAVWGGAGDTDLAGASFPVLLAASNHGCAAVLDPDDGAADLRCWGPSTYGESTLPGACHTSIPVPVAVPSDGRLMALATGQATTCGVWGGELWCWGWRALTWGASSGASTEAVRHGGHLTWGAEPVVAVGLGRNVDSAGCALVGTEVWCFGDDDLARGCGDVCYPNMLVNRVDVGGPAHLLAVSVRHSCAATGSDVWCWGHGVEGRLGNGDTVDSTTPVRVLGLPDTPTQLAAGGSHTCALVRGSAYCWGANRTMQLGVPTGAYHPAAVRVETDQTFVSLTGGGLSSATQHACALTDLGEVWCWGSNSHGQLSVDLVIPEAYAPQRVEGLVGQEIAVLDAGHISTCAASVAGDIWCWGAGHNGRLGDGGEICTDAKTLCPVPGPQQVVWNEETPDAVCP